MLRAKLHALTFFNLYYSCGITPKCATSDGAHLRGLSPGQIISKKHRSGGEPLATLSDLTGPGIEPQTYRTDNAAFTAGQVL